VFGSTTPYAIPPVPVTLTVNPPDATTRTGRTAQ
jgi:hypothetical protein